MGLQERDYMRSTYRGGYPRRTYGRPRLAEVLVPSCILIAVAAAGLLAARLALQNGWVMAKYLDRPESWRFHEHSMELPALVAALALIVAGRSNIARRPLLAGLCLIAGVAGTGWGALTPQSRSSIEDWVGCLGDRLFWRGPRGESLISGVYEGYGVIVQPNGNPVHLINNKSARNPSWQELMSFLRRDRTENNAYVPGDFVCSSFAEMLHNNAEAAGYSCAFVTVDLGSPSQGHACNAFETTDRGLVFVDCTNSIASGSGGNDLIVELRDGQEYTPRHIFPSNGWRYESMGIARNIRIH